MEQMHLSENAISRLTISSKNTTGIAALFSNKETEIVVVNLRKSDLLLQNQERLVFWFSSLAYCYVKLRHKGNPKTLSKL